MVICWEVLFGWLVCVQAGITVVQLSFCLACCFLVGIQNKGLCKNGNLNSHCAKYINDEINT